MINTGLIKNYIRTGSDKKSDEKAGDRDICLCHCPGGKVLSAMKN